MQENENEQEISIPDLMNRYSGQMCVLKSLLIEILFRLEKIDSIDPQHGTLDQLEETELELSHGDKFKKLGMTDLDPEFRKGIAECIQSMKQLIEIERLSKKLE